MEKLILAFVIVAVTATLVNAQTIVVRPKPSDCSLGTVIPGC